MHVIAGFESQIAAHGGALSIAGVAQDLGVTISGAALAQRDTARAIHVGPVQGFDIPEHALAVLDGIIVKDATRPSLQIGETALLVAFSDLSKHSVADLIARTDLEYRGALWVTTS